MTATEYSALIKRYQKQKKTIDVFSYLFIAIMAIGLIGVIVVVFMFGLSSYDRLYLIIAVHACLGGALVFGVAAFGALRLSASIHEKEIDARELADGENSFFVGDGTLATFEEKALRIHGFVANEKKEKNILIPYEEIRLFSVCSRRSPKDKGEWNVVFEIPMKYLSKKGKAQNGEPPALIQSSGKDRIFTCIKEHGLEILGELPKDTKATCEKERKFILPDREKRKRILLFWVLGGVLLAGGIVAMFVWNTTVGAVITVLGGYLFFHSCVNFIRAKSSIICYKEGIQKREPTSPDDLFLKWEEIEAYRQNGNTLRLQCAYGEYEIPAIDGVFEFLQEKFPDKCKNS